jgi:hypothetical protein
LLYYVIDQISHGKPNDYQYLLTGVGLLFVAIKVPDGIAGAVARRRHHERQREAHERRLEAASRGLPSIEVIDLVVEPDDEEPNPVERRR